MENWKDIPGYEGYYQMTSDGKVRSVDRYVKMVTGRSKKVVYRRYSGCILKPCRVKGMDVYQLSREGEARNWRVNNLVELTFANSNELTTAKEKGKAIKDLVTGKVYNSIMSACTDTHISYQKVRNDAYSNSRDHRFEFVEDDSNSITYVKPTKPNRFAKPVKDLLTNTYYPSISSASKNSGIPAISIREEVFGDNVNKRFVLVNEVDNTVEAPTQEQVNSSENTVVSNGAVTGSGSDEKGKNMKAIIVEWQDCGKSFCINNGWVSRDNVSFENNFVKYTTVGILLEETDTSITLANTIRGNDVLDPIMIVKSSILRRQEFDMKEDSSIETVTNKTEVYSPKRKRRQKLTDVELKSFIADYKSGMLTSEIALKYNLGHSTTLNKISHLIKSGVMERQPYHDKRLIAIDKNMSNGVYSKGTGKKLVYSDKFLKDCLALTVHDVVKKYGVSSKSFYNARRRANKILK